MVRNLKFLEHIQNSHLKPMFSEEELRLLFSDQEPYFIHNGISRNLKSGKLLKLRRGLYLLSDQSSSVSRLSIANHLYSPSFVSFESALSYHGLIPEAVYTMTSAFPLNKKKQFETSTGVYSFEYSPAFSFFLGVEKNADGVLMASPLRALFDLVSIRRKNYRTLVEMEGDLRIDLDQLQKEVETLSSKEIFVLAQSFKKKRLIEFASVLVQELK